jgi:hypothetical protein
MRFFFLLVVLLALVSLAVAVDLPSDHVQIAPLPAKMSLSGATSDSAKAIDAANPELTKPIRWDMAALGYYNSEKVTIDQDAEAPVGVPEKLLNFSQSKPIDLNKTSVGGLENLENMTIINDTMVWF